MRQVVVESKVDSLLSELKQIDRIAKQNNWTKEEEENAKTRLINDWKDNEHERHLIKKPSEKRAL